MNNDYYFDYNQSLALNVDYNQKIFISLKQGKNKDIIPVITYLGEDERMGENIKKNILSVLSFTRENNNLSMYMGKDKFAGFIVKDGQLIIDENVPQEHLTSFEMRLFSRGKSNNSLPFSREIDRSLAPKTDLHNHFAGCLPPEALIDVGLRHNISIPAWMLTKAGINTEETETDNKGDFLLSSVVKNKDSYRKLCNSMAIPFEKQETFNKMEEIYAFRGPFTKNPALFPDLLKEIGRELSESGIKYTELSLSSVISDMNCLKTIEQVLPEVEKETGCKIRFLAALWRHSDKEWNMDETDRIKAVAQNPYIVGLDVMGHETNPTETFGEEIKELAEWAMKNDPSFCIRIHAGENPLFKENVKDVLKIVKAARENVEIETGKTPFYPKIRIGHGLYGVDDETLSLCRETGAVVEFNMSSNLSLNNIDSIQEVPITQYVEKGIPFVLGTDGKGIYSTSAEQELILAHATGLRAADFIKMRRTENHIIEDSDKAFARKSEAFSKKLKTMTFEEALAPTYSTADGKPRYNENVEKKYAKQKQDLLNFLNSEISKCGAETNSTIIEEHTSGKMPILLTGASVKAWPDISPKDQEEIRVAMQALVNVLNPEKAYILTGGTNHGVEKQLHEVAHFRNTKQENKLIVMGTLTEDAAHKERASIEKDTITHATVLTLNNRIAKSWFDLPDAVLDYVQQRNGEMIAVGGGGVVRDMIQRAHNLGTIGLNLMDGPKGASTDKVKSLEGNDYGFVGARGLLTRMYNKHPEIFVEGFDIQKVDEYVSQARTEQGKSAENQAMQETIKKLKNKLR